MDINYAHFYLVNQFKSSTTKAIENKNYNGDFESDENYVSGSNFSLIVCFKRMHFNILKVGCSVLPVYCLLHWGQIIVVPW